MKSKVFFKRLISTFFVAAGVLVFNSCAVYNPANQASLPVDDIIQMSKDGVSSKNIIQQIRKSHSVYLLSASELSRLSSEGVRDSVINYMEKTHINAIIRNQQYADSYYGYRGMYGYPYYGFGFGFGWPYAYGGWGYNHVIVSRGGVNRGGYRGRH